MKNKWMAAVLSSGLLLSTPVWTNAHSVNIAKAATVTTYTTTAAINVRSGAGTKYKVLGKLKKGEKVTVKKTVGTWYQITFKGKTAYVSKSYVKKTTTSTAPSSPTKPSSPTTKSYTTTAELNVRAGAGTKYKVLGKLKKGEKVTIKKTVGTWYQITFKGKTGYISKSYVKVTTVTEQEQLPITQQGTYQTTADLNVRSGAGTKYNIIGKLKKGDAVNIVKNVGTWHQISYNGKLGYVSGSYVKKVENTTPEVTEPTEKRYEAGMYKVGIDIPAGEYKLYSNYMGWMYQYLNSNKQGKILEESFYNFGYVTLTDGQYFELEDAYAVPIAQAKPYNPSEHNNKYIAGMYKVGFDAPAGEYKFFATTNHLGWVNQYMAANKKNEVLDDAVENMAYYTIKNSGYFEIEDAYGQYLGATTTPSTPTKPTLTTITLTSGDYKNGEDFVLAPGLYQLTLNWETTDSYADFAIYNRKGSIIKKESFYERYEHTAELIRDENGNFTYKYKTRTLPTYIINIDDATEFDFDNIRATLVKQ